MLDLSFPPDDRPWLTSELFWPELTTATENLDAPVAALHLGALRHNAHDLLDRAAGIPLRAASKSIRVRGVLEALLALPGYRGLLAYSLAEALWFAETLTDVVVGYFTADQAAIHRLGRSPELTASVTLTVDSVAIVERPGFSLVGVMSYEAQVAGIGDKEAGKPLRGLVSHWIRQRSISEITARRGAAVAAVREVAPLEFVNGGGTGSVESTRADTSVTDIAVGSGLVGRHLFDNYASFRPAAAAAVAPGVVRTPTSDMAVLLGGGWVASGVPGADRVPRLVWPEGLRLVPREMTGEVQTPVTGAGAARLRVGDRVWARHTKSGELSEHINEFALVENRMVVDILPTYRGEGKAFP